MQLALDILTYHQQRNHAAYLSHRQRRITLATQRECILVVVLEREDLLSQPPEVVV